MKKSPKTNQPSITKSPKSSIKDSTTDLPGTSLNTNCNVVETKTAVSKKKSARKSQQKLSKTVEEVISQDLFCDIGNEEPPKLSKSNVQENDSVKQIAENETLQNITNISKKEHLQTSTPKKELPKITKKTTKKRDSTAKNKTLKVKDSENKSKRRKSQKIRKNVEDKQSESKISIIFLNYISQFLHMSQTLNNENVIFFR